MGHLILYAFTLVVSTFIAIPCVRNSSIGFLKFIGGWTIVWIIFLGAHPTRVTTLVIIGVLGYGLALMFFDRVAPHHEESQIDDEIE